MIGKTLAHYKVVGRLGKGGMGEVYLAEDTRLSRMVALKTLPPEMAMDPDRRARFEREAKIVAALNHPNIITIHSVEDCDGLSFITMELIEGKVLSDLITKDGLPLRRFFDIAVPLADALSAAHQKGVTHRDLKPANVMVTGEGRVKVLDFGLAKQHDPSGLGENTQAATATAITQEGKIVGTVAYMSPEQAEGKTVDARSDVFSLGTMLYEMVSGRRPFQGDSAIALLSSVLKDDPPPVEGLPGSLNSILRKCLAKDPADRYQDGKALLQEISNVKNAEHILEGFAKAGLDIGAPAGARPSAARRTRFVGRDAERAELQRFLSQLAGGQGGLVLIGGEPGVGKTRLAEELLTEVRRARMLSLVGRCYEMEGAPPYIPFVETLEHAVRVVPHAALREAMGEAAPEVARLMPELRRVFPDIPAPIELPPEQQRRYLFNGFLEFVERSSRVQPTVLLLDDLHWADESTLLLLQHIAQRLRTIPLLIVGTYRDVDLDVALPFAKVLEVLLRKRLAHRLTLRRLSEEGLAEMLEALAGQAPPSSLVAAIYHETEGNPFFVEEVFQHLSDEGKLFDEQGDWLADMRIEDLEVPEGVRLVVGRRLERLGEGSRRLLTTAAIIGRGFSLELLNALAEVEGDALLDAVEEAEAAHLITSSSSDRDIRYRFTHELIRNTLAGSLSLPRRQRVHLQVAEAMEQLYAADLGGHASDLAHHLYQAGAAAEPQKTVRYLTLAGERALKATASEDALRLFDTALSLQPVEDKPGYAHLLFQRGLARRSLGLWDESMADWSEALPIYEELGDAAAVSRICGGMGVVLIWAARWQECVQLGRRGLRVVGDQASRERCHLLMISAAGLALGMAEEGNYATAQNQLAEAEAIARELADDSLLGTVLYYKGLPLACSMRVPQAVETHESAIKLLRQTKNWDFASALSMAQTGMLSLGRPEDAEKLGDEAEPLAERVGHLGHLYFARAARALGEVMRTGKLARFGGSIAGLRELALATGVFNLLLNYASLGLFELWSGRWTAAIENSQEAAGRDTAFMNGSGSGLHFLVKAYLGHEDALRVLNDKRDCLPRPGQANTAGAWHLLLRAVEGLAVLDRREEAAKLYPLTVEAIDTGTIVLVWHEALLQKIAGIAAAAGEQWEHAEQHFETALRQAQEIPNRIEQPEVRRWYARMLIDRNAPDDREKAHKLLAEAIESYRQIGMPRHLELAEELLSR